MRVFTAFVLCTCTAAVYAQDGIHACVADAAAQKVYSQHRNSPDRMEALREALKADPDNLFLHRWLLLSNDVRPGSLAEEYRLKLAAHPDDALYLYLYGYALAGGDTRHAIELIDQALAKDPELVYAYQTMLEIYSKPKFRDPRRWLRICRPSPRAARGT
jgi:tetratricopeptide (TPR) repeat protein